MTYQTLIAAAVLAVPVAARAQAVTDPQIAHIVVTANQVDIDAGKLASARATSPQVKQFGALMVTDHTGVNKAAVELATKLKVTPEDNPTSQSLKKGGEDNVAALKGLKGAAFDKAYVDHEVAYHQQVLDAVDKVLIPGATNAELKALLVKTRPAFVAHLEHAKKVQADLAGKKVSHAVTIEGTRYEPARLTIRAGDTVVWVNKDYIPHTVTGAGGRFDSRTMAAGASWQHTLKAKGAYGYACTFHPTMTGTVEVE